MKVKLVLSVIIILLLGTACSLSNPRQTANPPAPTAEAVQVINQPTVTPEICPVPGQAADITPAEVQPVEIKGSFTYSNDIIITYYVEQAVALTDMYGFVKRDREWEIPVASQTLGFLNIDKA
ncbi:MAG: peptidase S41, partial [Anaerolineaceae bacterium]|nr:peptidase S41 [Anaerolineaceae bacterium]